MTIDELLASVSLPQYREAFRANDIDDDILFELTNEDLKELGINSLGHRKRILSALRVLKDSAENRAVAGPGARVRRTNAPSSTSTITREASELKQRREVTAVFADLTGYTTLTHELPVENVHDILSSFYERFDGIVKRLGGTVDRHIGDCVMAVFGAPISYGNDVERALRCTVAMHEAMKELTRRHGRNLSVHIGVAAGRVLFANRGQGDMTQDFTLTGDTVNLASRLAEKANGGETLVSGRIRTLLAASIECVDLDHVEAKGFADPIPVHRFVRFRERRRDSHFVGRKGELETAVGALAACRRDGRGQVLCVRGEAGIGKSAFLDRVAQSAREHGFETHKALLLDFGLGDTDGALATILAHVSGLDTSATESAIRQAAAGWMVRGVLDEHGCDVFHAIMGLRLEGAARTRIEALDNAARLAARRGTVAGVVTAAARERPLMLIIEDLHWANTEELALAAHLSRVTTDVPLILALTTRVEGDQIDAGWLGTIEPALFRRIDLHPLSADEAAALAAERMGAEDGVIRECIEKAEGNPLFLDQLLRHATDDGGTAVPGSIQSLIQSRLDRLTWDDRRVIAGAAVLGQRFSMEAALAMAGIEVYDERPLVDASMVRPVSGGFLFTHALIREGIYDTILRGDLEALHGRAAEWFEHRDAALYAEHLELAGDPQAARAYRSAAAAARGEHRLDAALSLAQRGLSVARTHTGQDDGETYALLILVGDLLRDLGRGDASLRSFEEALSLANNESQTLQARIGLISTMRILDRLSDADALIEIAERTSPSSELLPHLSRLYYLKGSLCFPKGDFRGGMEAHSLARDHARSAGEPELEARALSGLGDAYYAQGRMFRAHGVFEQCLDLCERHGLGAVEAANRFMRGTVRIYMNDTQGALDDALRSAELARKIGQLRPEIVSRLTAGWVLQSMNRQGEARAQIERGLEATAQLGAPRFEPFLQETLVRVLLSEGDRAAARKLAKHMVAKARALSAMHFIGPWLLASAALASEASERNDLLAEGEALLEEGCVGHNHFRYPIYAGSCALEDGDIAGLRRCCDMLDNYTREEPTPWSDLYIALGRTAADYVEREPTAAERLKDIQRRARAASLFAASNRIDQILSARVPAEA